MYALFKKSGHLDCFLINPPAILPNGWFFKQVESIVEPIWSDGQTVFYPSSRPPSEDYSWEFGEWVLNQNLILAAARAKKISQLNSAAQAFISSAAGIDMLPEFEIQTWAIQGNEAKLWQADSASPTPVLDKIASSRGISAEKLKAAALRKTLAYETLTAHIAGQRQALQSKIEAAKTQAELDKIKIEFTGPETV